MRRTSAAALSALLLLAGCGSSEGSVERDLLRGVAQIRTTPDRKKLETALGRTIASLRRDRPRTAADRRARDFALRGFESTVRGVRSELDFETNLRAEIWAVHIGQQLGIDPTHVEDVVSKAIEGSRRQLAG